MRAALPSVMLWFTVALAPAAAWAAPATGTVIIDGAPAGAPVLIDGQSIGQAPLPGPWTLPAGDHDVKIGERSQQVTVKPGAQVAVNYAAQAAVEPPPAVVAATAPADRFPVVTAGYVGAGAGLLAIGAGLFFGLADADDVSEEEANAVFANIGYGIGGVLLAGGAAMIIWGDDGASSVGIAPTQNGAVIGGRF